MKTNCVRWMKATLFGCAVLFLAGCKHSDEPAAQGDTEFQIMDAPTDDANVSGVFVTITDIKVDGQSVSGFTKQTVNLKAYQNGDTKTLGTYKLNAHQYSTLELVLDTDTDADGTAPGSYVMTTDNSKFKLRSGGMVSIPVNQTWTVAGNAKSTILIDFDLRKSVKKMDDANVRYNFVSDDNLKAAVHVANKELTGTVKGSYTEQMDTHADKILVFAYAKGTFNASTETTPQGDDAILFKNAVSSAEVKSGGSGKTYTLALLEEGNYELHFASYNADGDNHFTFNSALQSQTSVSGSPEDTISIQGGITTTVTSTITGL